MNKMNIGKLAEKFSASVDKILNFTELVTADETLVDDHESWCFDHAIIRLCREFENFMLHCLIGLINNDSSTLSSKTGIEFPQHMKVEICEYLVRGDGYFDFKGRSGLIKKIKQFVPSKPENWFLKIVKKCEYKNSLDRLIALRNFAAHNSPHAKKSALEYTGQQNMSSSGAWLKISDPRQTDGNRFTKICESLKRMAKEIGNMAEAEAEAEAKEIENQAR